MSGTARHITVTHLNQCPFEGECQKEKCSNAKRIIIITITISLVDNFLLLRTCLLSTSADLSRGTTGLVFFFFSSCTEMLRIGYMKQNMISNKYFNFGGSMGDYKNIPRVQWWQKG